MKWTVLVFVMVSCAGQCLKPEHWKGLPEGVTVTCGESNDREYSCVGTDGAVYLCVGDSILACSTTTMTCAVSPVMKKTKVIHDTTYVPQ